jgi:hypothetical protein
MPRLKFENNISSRNGLFSKLQIEEKMCPKFEETLFY